MPLDVIFEVLSHLDPLDLLHLARTTKNFRVLLMNRRNAAYWKAAWRNVDGLPECPEGMSHPALTNFLFCSNCHVCFAINSQWMMWDHTARYCRKCKRNIYASHKLFPSQRSSIWQVFDDQGLEVLPTLQEIMLYRVCEVWTKHNFGEDGQIYPHDGVIFFQDVEDLRCKVSSMSVEARTAYIVDQVHARDQWREHSYRFQKWYETRKMIRSTEMYTLRASRYDDVLAKLQETGWGEEVANMTYSERRKFRSLSAVRQPRALTDRSWKLAAPSIIKIMQAIRARRLQMLEHRNSLRERLEALDRSLLGLSLKVCPAQLAELQTSRGIARIREIARDPQSEIGEYQYSQFMEKIGSIETIATGWTNRDVNLCALVSQKVSERHLHCDAAVEPLSLAVAALYRCKTRPHLGHVYPPIHACKHYPQLTESDSCGTRPVEIAGKRFRDPTSFVPAFEELVPIIEKCGFSPARATIANMNNSQVRLACTRCWSLPRPVLPVMSWFAAFVHCRPASSACSIGDLCQLIASDGLKAAIIEAEQVYVENSRSRSLHFNEYSCLHCSQPSAREQSMQYIVEHVRSMHRIIEPRNGEAYWPVWETAECYDALVYLVPAKYWGTNKEFLDPQNLAPKVYFKSDDSVPCPDAEDASACTRLQE